MMHRLTTIRRLSLPGLLLALCVWVLPAHSADEPAYRVEMIIFRSNSIGGAPEDWNIAPQPRGFGNGSVHGAAPQLLALAPASQYQLDGIDTRLRSSGIGRPLVHIAWTQTAAPWGTHTGLSLADLGVHIPDLSGTVYFERGQQYAHLGMDIALGSYRIDEMRSIKYGEKQYFDHPAFGVIAVVTPLRGGAGG